MLINWLGLKGLTPTQRNEAFFRFFFCRQGMVRLTFFSFGRGGGEGDWKGDFCAKWFFGTILRKILFSHTFCL